MRQVLAALPLLLLASAQPCLASDVTVGPLRPMDDVPLVAGLGDLRRAELPADHGGRYAFLIGAYWESNFGPVEKRRFDGDGVPVGAAEQWPEGPGQRGSSRIVNLPNGTVSAVAEGEHSCLAILGTFRSDGSATRHPVSLPQASGCGEAGATYVPHHDGSWWRVAETTDGVGILRLVVTRVTEAGAEAPWELPVTARTRSFRFDAERGLAFGEDGSAVLAWSSPRRYGLVLARVLGPDGSLRRRRIRLAPGGSAAWGIHAQSIGADHVVVGWRTPGGNAAWTGRDLWLQTGAEPSRSTVQSAAADTSPAATDATVVRAFAAIDASAPASGPSADLNAPPLQLAPIPEFTPERLGDMSLADGRVATNGRGTWIVAWSHVPPSGRSTVFVDVSHDNGRTWTGPLPIGHGDSPAIASNGRRSWLLTAHICLWDDPSECVWKVWRSSSNGDLWESNLDEYAEQWTDYLSPSGPQDNDDHSGRASLFSTGPGDWTVAVPAYYDGENYMDNYPRVTTWRSASDGRTWSPPRETWEESFVAPRAEPVVVLPFPNREPLALWKLATLRGERVAPAAERWVPPAPATLTPHWSDHGPSGLHGSGFSADVDATGVAVAAWPSRNLATSGWGWDGDIVFSRSTDGGDTWSDPAPVAAAAWSDNFLDEEPHVLALGDGEWIAAWMSLDPRASGGVGRGAFVAALSYDGGLTWSEPQAITPEGYDTARRGRGLLSAAGDAQGSRRGWAALWSGPETGVGGDLWRPWLLMTPPDSTCGDGLRQDDEECDDGDAENGDGCDTNCRRTSCGNGVLTAGETCDDGNRWDGDACSPDCGPTSCGDGAVRWDVEECDDGNDVDGDGCDTNCRRTDCRNGIVTGHEECDDGNADTGDACDPNCTLPRCGNGLRGAGEECDDGNTRDDDACLTTCVESRCGDGVVRASTCPPRRPDCSWGRGEECDDANTVDEDACLSTCVANRCGDGFRNPATEVCDDGANGNGDGCDENCTPTACGNGVVTNGELCDDGDTANGGGCSADCLSFPTICGDVDADGTVTLADADAIAAAVDAGGDCPLWRCDLDSDLAVTVADADLARRKSAGLEVPRGCEREITFLVSGLPDQSLATATVRHGGAVGTFWETRGKVWCRPLTAFAVGFETTGRLGFLLRGDATTTPGPAPVIACRMRAFGPVAAGDFRVELAADQDIEPRPVVSVIVD